MVSDLRLLRGNEGQHAGDLLFRNCAHARHVALDRRRNEFRALHRRAGGRPPFQRDDVQTGGRCRPSGAAPCRPKPDHKNVRRFDRHKSSLCGAGAPSG